MVKCSEASQKVRLYAGDALDIRFTILKADDAPLDLTNYTIVFTAAGTINKSSAVPGEIEKTDATAGIATVHLLSTDTQNLDPDDEYTYQARVMDSSFQYFTFAKDDFIVGE